MYVKESTTQVCESTLYRVSFPLRWRGSVLSSVCPDIVLGRLDPGSMPSLSLADADTLLLEYLYASYSTAVRQFSGGVGERSGGNLYRLLGPAAHRPHSPS